MAAFKTDVLLITEDRELEGSVAAARPDGGTLQVLQAEEVAAATATAQQLWLDLDHAPGTLAPQIHRRVYFHSQPVPGSKKLPPGIFIHKPCTPSVVEVLWSAVNPPPSIAPRRPARRTVPQWLLEYHDLNLRSLCRRLVTTLGPRLGYRDTSLYLHDQRNSVFTLAETTHQRAIDLVIPTSAVEQSLMAVVARTGQALRTVRAAEEMRRAGIAARAHPYGDGDCVVAPLLDEGRLWGMLNFSGRRDDAAAVGDLPHDAIFSFIARALHHARAYEQARTEARIDSLTGLYNQRWITESLEREIRRVERFGTPLSVLMLDLDGLKQVNDGEGHAAGDCVLRHVASRISGVLRQFDGAARIGGDEFVVMLPATDLGGAQQVARRLLQSICDDTALHRDRPLHISASIGAAQWQPGLAARQLLDLADRAMYEAKAQGRGTLVCAPGASDSPPSQSEGLGEGVRVGST